MQAWARVHVSCARKKTMSAWSEYSLCETLIYLWTWVRAPARASTRASLCLFFRGVFVFFWSPFLFCVRYYFVFYTKCVCSVLFFASSVSCWALFHLVLAPLPQARPGGEPCIYVPVDTGFANPVAVLVNYYLHRLVGYMFCTLVNLVNYYLHRLVGYMFCTLVKTGHAVLSVASRAGGYCVNCLLRFNCVRLLVEASNKNQTFLPRRFSVDRRRSSASGLCAYGISGLTYIPRNGPL